MKSAKWYLNWFLSDGHRGRTAIWSASREDGEADEGVAVGGRCRRWMLLIFRSCEDAPITAN